MPKKCICISYFHFITIQCFNLISCSSFLMFFFRLNHCLRMDMDPIIWSRFPFEIMEIIFLWLPFSTLICFRTVSKQWNVILQNIHFLSQCNRLSIKEFGFVVPSFNVQHRSFLATYLHQKRCTSPLVVPFIESSYKVECIVGSMILLSKPTGCSHTNNYFVLNPFTKDFKHLGSLWVGDCGFFLFITECNCSEI